QLAEQIAASSTPPHVFICASAMGFYGNRGSELLDESSNGGKGFLADVCREWESATQPARSAGIRTINLRTGIVLAKEGGALNRMIKVFRRGGGAILGDGKQYMSWISLDDVVLAIEYIIQMLSISGPVNLVSPHPVTNREFTQTLSRLMKRPSFMKIPKTVLRLLVGEMADEVLFYSEKAYPEKLIKAGYSFKHEHLEEALRSNLV
ncbi:MAG: TIGR01777 family oxidoreductase, partial [Spirochaetales bacterium]|nr:TIGR01777 family oxidoreductase [Spirochaetales bacterium]